MSIEYKELIFDEKAIYDLYYLNGWFAYTNDTKQLYGGIRNSLDVYGAYDGELLVGLIRTIGDGFSITYIQDILIMPEYQRKGIGAGLMDIIIEKNKNVRSIVLMTDMDDERSNSFYVKYGFTNYNDKKASGYIYTGKK